MTTRGAARPAAAGRLRTAANAGPSTVGKGAPSGTDQPPVYVCQRCGNCCRWEGYVMVTPAEVAALAAHCGLDVATFTARYTRLTRNRAGLSLTEKDDGACVFFREPAACDVYPVRPAQCRDFPNRWRFPLFERVCAARRQPADNEPARGTDPRAAE